MARLEAVARLMDGAFVVPGTTIRFGLDGKLTEQAREYGEKPKGLSKISSHMSRSRCVGDINPFCNHLAKGADTNVIRSPEQTSCARKLEETLPTAGLIRRVRIPHKLGKEGA